MFNLEGTAHEKAVLVILSFIIGLTCGYIAFYFQQGKEKMMTEYYSVPVTVPAMDPTMATPGEVLGEESQQTGITYYQDNFLYVESPEGQMVLSVHVDEFGDEGVPDFLTQQGSHVIEPIVVEAPDGSAVFFCESNTSASECNAYVFMSDTATVYAAEVDWEPVVLTTAEAATATWTESGLGVAGFTAANASPRTFTLSTGATLSN